MTISLTDRLAKIAELDANCAKLKDRRDRLSQGRKGISFVQWKLVMERAKQMRAEMRFEKQQRSA